MKKLLIYHLLIAMASFSWSQSNDGNVLSAGGGVLLNTDAQLQSTFIIGDPGASAMRPSDGSLSIQPGFIFIFDQPIPPSSEGVNEVDSLSLVAFYKNANGSTWTQNTGWLSSPVKDWHGVGVEGVRVTVLELQGNNLSGRITDSISLITELNTLDLSSNSLEGNVPAVEALQNLAVLKLSDNQLSGVVREGIGSISSLQFLELANNQISGVLPHTLVNLGSLVSLDLSGNAITGKLPPNMGKMGGLVDLNLSGNQLNDTLSLSIDSLINLRALDLSDNRFFGPLPPFVRLVNLESVDISNNDLEGSLNFLLNANGIQSVNVAGNRLSVLPNMTSRSELVALDVRNNQLDFGDIEPNAGLANFEYAPQDSLGVGLDTLHVDGQPIQFFLDVDGSANAYQWSKDGSNLDGANLSSYFIAAAASADEGEYVLEITNSVVDDLTLYSNIYDLTISSRRRDSLSLVAIYAAANGDGWTDNGQWNTGPINEWVGVGMNDGNTRVEELVLDNNNLAGVLSREVTKIGNLQRLNVSGNSLTDIPDLSGMSSLTSVDVSNNQLEFDDLEPNAGIATFLYTGQANLELFSGDTIPKGDDLFMDVLSRGSANTYQWFFEENPIDGATNPFYTIDQIDFDKMGEYRLDISNANLPDLTLSTNSNRVLASADLIFFALGQNNEPLSDGSGYALKIEEPGRPFDSVAVIQSQAANFIFEDLVLGDYLIAFESDPEIYVPTYYENTFLWEEADTLLLREEVRDTLFMTIVPEPLDETDEGRVFGVVEAEFEEQGTGGRFLLERRKVKKAGCSVRRFKAAGRGQDGIWELIAYVETNDEGEFEFNFLPPGTYRFNIEYPGIPMDPDSFVEFEIGGDGFNANNFKLEAFVTEDGIEVTRVEALAIYYQSFRNLQVYPIPANERLNIRYDRLFKDNVEMQLLDLSGNIMLREKVDRGFNRVYDLDVSALAEGFYLLNFFESGSATVVSYKIYIRH